MKQTSQPREDLRQRRTRKLLADALLSLLEELPGTALPQIFPGLAGLFQWDPLLILGWEEV